MAEQSTFREDRLPQESEQSSEAREVAHYARLRGIFRGDTAYTDLFANMYKYANDVQIPGVAQEKNQDIFARVCAGNALVDSMLYYYASAKKAEAGHSADKQVALEGVEVAMENSSTFLSDDRSKVNGDQLLTMIEWSLTAWDSLGQKYGRPTTVALGEIPGIVGELRAIVDMVNRDLPNPSR